MTASPETLAYLDQVLAFYEDPANADKDPSEAPEPPNRRVALDVAAGSAKTMAVLLQYMATGAVSLDPDIEFRLAASERIDEYRRNNP